MAVLDTLGSIGGALSGASAFMGSLNQIFSGNDYQRQADQAYVRQREMMNANNKFQAEENQKSRDYTREMYEKQWSDYTDFNSYASMVRRAEEAGVSPASLFQSGAPSSIGGFSPASVGHTASPSPSYADIVNPVNRQAETFHSISQGLQALSQASKLGFETTQIVPLMSAQIKNQLSAAGLNDIRQKSEDFELGLRQIYGKKLYDSEVGKNFAQMINSYNQAYLYAEEGNTQESIRELNKADRLYKDSLRLSTDKQVEFMNLQMSWYPKEMRAKINNLNSSAAESRANAAVLNEEKRLRAVAANIKEANSSQELDTVLDELHAKQAVSVEQYNKAQVELHKLDKILRGYKNSENLQKVDAILQNFFSIIGLNTSVSVSAK